MGTPAQKMTMMFDSGSALLYIVTDKCKSCPQKMDKFTTADSKTYKPTGERQSQSYGQGKIEGEVAQDTVCFTPEGLSCIEETTFVAVDTAADLEKDRFSGIVGLSPF
tara:strand:+ start:214 stop:537 length:324 start_codon:yes stop_codon:yes gene_type:complete